MKNLKAKAMMAKYKLETVSMRAKAAVICTLATICPAYCDINGNSAMQKFLKTMFSIMTICVLWGLRGTVEVDVFSTSEDERIKQFNYK